MVLPYVREGNSIIIPVTFEGPSGLVELPMIFDTGATLTTLNQDSLDAAGIVVAPDAPEITSQTAGGMRKSRVTFTQGVRIGGRRIENVTLSRCEPCADESARGLLGMNVSGRFLIMIDTEDQRLILRPRRGGQTKDIEVWLDVSAEATRFPNGESEVVLTVNNKGVQSVGRARVLVQCGQDFFGEVTNIPAKGRASTTLSLPSSAQCAAYSIELDEAEW